MNETLKIEQAYFDALGIKTHYVNDEYAKSEYLVSTNTNTQMYGLVFSTMQSHNLMLGHEVNVEFHPNEVWASHPDGTTNHCVRYGDAQWKSKQWAFGMAVVQAVTDKIMRMKL
jgi:proteasome assembly chaperone (PAC2) family protein